MDNHCAYCFIEKNQLVPAFMIVDGTSVCREHVHHRLVQQRSREAGLPQPPKPPMPPSPVPPIPPKPAAAPVAEPARPMPKPGDKLKK